MGELAITVVGSDRPGIVADVTGLLAPLNLHLTDSTTTLLRGYFALTLVCSGPAPAAAVQESLRAVTEDGSLLAVVREVPPEIAVGSGTLYTLTVYGADRLGIVAAMTRAVADAGGNVTDLNIRLTGVLYLLSAEVDLPSTVEADMLADRLTELADQLGVEVSLRSTEADVL